MRVVEHLEHCEQGVGRRLRLSQVRAHEEGLLPGKSCQPLREVTQSPGAKHHDGMVGIEPQEHRASLPGGPGNGSEQVEPVDERSNEACARHGNRTNGHDYFQLQPAWAPQSVGFEKVSQDVW